MTHRFGLLTLLLLAGQATAAPAPLEKPSRSVGPTPDEVIAGLRREGFRFGDMKPGPDGETWQVMMLVPGKPGRLRRLHYATYGIPTGRGDPRPALRNFLQRYNAVEQAQARP